MKIIIEIDFLRPRKSAVLNKELEVFDLLYPERMSYDTATLPLTNPGVCHRIPTHTSQLKHGSLLCVHPVLIVEARDRFLQATDVYFPPFFLISL